MVPTEFRAARVGTGGVKAVEGVYLCSHCEAGAQTMLRLLTAKFAATVCHQKARRRSSDITHAFLRDEEQAPTFVGCGWH